MASVAANDTHRQCSDIAIIVKREGIRIVTPNDELLSSLMANTEPLVASAANTAIAANIASSFINLALDHSYKSAMSVNIDFASISNLSKRKCL